MPEISAATGADGAARFTGLPYADWTIQVTRPSSGIARTWVFRSELDASEAGDPLVREFILSHGIELQGTVVGLPEGRPVPGALVKVEAETPGVRGADVVTECQTTADANGAFVLKGVPERARLEIFASAEGWATSSARAGNAASTATQGVVESVRIELRRAVIIRGSVIGPDRRPLPKARVWVEEKAYERTIAWLQDGRLIPSLTRGPDCTSDAEGQYEVKGLAAGETYVVLAHAGEDGQSDVHTVLLAEDSPAEVPLDIPIRPPTRLRVRILGPDGEPATGRLEAWLTFPDDSGRGLSVQGAQVESPDLKGGTYLLSITSSRFAEAELRFEVEPGQSVDRTIRLEPGVSMTGRVVDGDGRGVSGAKLVAISAEEGGLSRSEAGVANTDDRGCFEIAGLRPGTYQLRMEQRRGDWRWLGENEAPARDLLFRAGGSLTFRLVPPPGRSIPLGGGAVVIRLRESGEGAWTNLYESGSTWRAENTQLDSETGRWTFRVVPPGDIDLVFRVRGYGPVRRRVAVPSGGTVSLGDLVLGPGVSLRGRVVDETGAPTPGVCVMVENEQFDYSSVAKSLADGTFEIPDLEPGAGLLKHWGPFDLEERYLSNQVPVVVEADMKPVVVTLDPGVLCRILVLGTDGKPVSDVSVESLLAGKSEKDLVSLGPTEGNGIVEKRLKPGTHEFRVLSKDRHSELMRRAIDVPRSASAQFELRLDADGPR